jgi:hypothetical protein
MSDQPTGNFIIYQTEDGRSQVECRLQDETISEHLQNLFEEGELEENAVVRNFRTTAADGKDYNVAHYNLEVVLQGPGSISNENIKAITHERYEAFDANRRAEEARLADTEDLKAIEELQKDLRNKKQGGHP